MEIEPKVKQEQTHIANDVNTKSSKIIVEPRLKPVPYKAQDLKPGNRISKTPTTTIKNRQFYVNEDNPLNKRGYKYKPCKPNPELKLILYSTTDLPPFNVRPSYFDKASGIIFDENFAVSNKEGWRSIRTNVGVKEGKWYFEFDIEKANEGDNCHVRVGIGRKEASLEAPVGFDGYGYGVRDIGGQKVTLSRPQKFLDVGFGTGDTIGILIELPDLKPQYDQIPLNRFNEHGNIVRDQIPIKYKNSLYFEQFEYTDIENMTKLLNPIKLQGEKLSSLDETIDLPKIQGSKMKLYKNGEFMGTMFEDLYLFLPIPGNLNQNQNQNFRNCDDGSLGYYPMISIYNEAIVKFNPGPDFKTALPDGVKGICDRYSELVVEQWYFDLIDEIEGEYLDSLESH